MIRLTAASGVLYRRIYGCLPYLNESTHLINADLGFYPTDPVTTTAKVCLGPGIELPVGLKILNKTKSIPFFRSCPARLVTFPTPVVQMGPDLPARLYIARVGWPGTLSSALCFGMAVDHCGKC